MTTIAYKAGVLASDSQCTSSFKSKIQKLFKVKDGYVGIAGRVTSAMLVVDWLNKPDTPPPKLADDEEFEALQLTKKGLFYWDSKLRPIRLTDPYTAIGSGCDFAMGAMAQGADAKAAVRIAAKLDTGTGGTVRAVSLKGKR